MANIVIIKAIGVGLAVAIAIDATVVRILIVPAVMRLLGRANWWAPRPLALFHRWVGAGESTAPRTGAVYGGK
jgi:RND superfamily putative drug exporter